MSRIFLSHSSKNNAEALALRDWLATQGWNDVFLDIDPVRGLVAADRWQKALRSAIGRCRAVIFLVSPEWLESRHCISELDLAGHVGAEIVGVLIRDVPLEKIPSELAGERQVLKLFRGGTPVTFKVSPPPSRKTVEVTFPEEDLRGLRAALAGLGLVGFETESFPWPPEGKPDRPPYRGLEAFDTDDAGVFFGRDSEIVRAREELIDLRARSGRKMFVILGASGAGKSSFLRAGLIPRLEREDRDFLTLPLIHPKNAALSGETGLARCLEKAFEDLHAPRPLGELISTLESDRNGLPPLLNRLQTLAMEQQVGDAKPQVERPPTILIPVDQAEELFAFEGGGEAKLTRQHLAAAIRRGPDCIALATIRSDRFSLLQDDPQFKDLLEPFNLPSVTPFAFREAIMRPGQRADPPIAVDAKLADALLADTAKEGADPLPLLAFTLERLYRGYGRVLHKMELEHYEKLGRIRGTINAALKDAFANPDRSPAIPADPAARERLLEAAFIPALADINEANGEPLSRIAPEAEIPAECAALISRLVEARLIVRDKGAPNGDQAEQTTVRVAHEALLRQWDWLRDLLERKAELLQTVRSVERAAQDWDDRGRSVDWLDLQGDRLADAETVAGRKAYAGRLAGLPAIYLAECRKREDAVAAENRETRRREQRDKWILRVVLSVSFVAVFVFGWAQRAYLQELYENVHANVRLWPVFWDVSPDLLSEPDERLAETGFGFQECANCPAMIIVPKGNFMMGSPEDEQGHDPDEGPQRPVTISRPFAVGMFEVTFDQWDACVAHGGCTERPSDEGWGRGDRPVINVRWDDAREYVEWLSGVTGRKYRLLSEAEWEYAARGVTSVDAPSVRFSWGDEDPVCEKGSVNAAVFRACEGQGTKPVGFSAPNAFGLYDMHGNVLEWVEDGGHDNYEGVPPDERVWDEGTDPGRRFLRGGSWGINPEYLRSAIRFGDYTDIGLHSYGFRVGRTL